jgi:hypothetical protein
MQRQNSTKRMPKRGSKNQNKSTTRLPPLLQAYNGQLVKQFKVEATPLTVLTTVTTGVIAQVFAVKASNVANFATRFGALFEEYRIVKAKFTFKCFSSTNPGLFIHWVDEKQTANPTSAEALQKSVKSFPASSPSPHVLTWIANDPLDLQYVDIGTTSTELCTYKVYTDNTLFGSSIVATAYGTVFPEFWIQFRGLN